MRKIVLALLATLALSATAKANEFDCMGDGPMSQACELAQMQRDKQNERRAQREREQERAQPYYSRSYHLPY
jgi:hypothetical protein